MVDLVLVRHGRTEWNRVRRIQGQLDAHLDEVGHAQAAAAAPVLAALGPARLWSSDSSRARDTAAYVAKECGLGPTYDERLREYSLGPREGLYHHEYEADDGAEYAEFASGNWDAVAGAEKRAAVSARMAAAVADLVEGLPDDGVALAVSHGAAIRTACATLLGWPDQLTRTLHAMDNCGWTVLRRREPEAPWRLVAYNRTVTDSAGATG